MLFWFLASQHQNTQNKQNKQTDKNEPQDSNKQMKMMSFLFFACTTKKHTPGIKRADDDDGLGFLFLFVFFCLGGVLLLVFRSDVDKQRSFQESEKRNRQESPPPPGEPRGPDNRKPLDTVKRIRLEKKDG